MQFDMSFTAIGRVKEFKITTAHECSTYIYEMYIRK